MLRLLTRLILLLFAGLLASGVVNARIQNRVWPPDLSAQKLASWGSDPEVAVLRQAAALQAAELQHGTASHGYDFASGRLLAAERTAVRTNFQAYEVLSQQTISGASRGAHRAAANRALLNQLDNSPELSRMFNQQLGTDVAAHMRLGKGAPLNPPGAVWHHPIDNPNALQLLRQVEHTTPALQPVLHPQGIGGFGTFYGP